MALITTPGASNANSYCSVSEATTLLTQERLYAEAWVNATNEKKEASLVWATRLLDSTFDYVGVVRFIGQSLGWPRAAVSDREGRNVDAETIPERVKRATAELAYNLVKRNRVDEPSILGKGITDAKVGPLSVSINADQRLQVVPDMVAAILGEFATIRESIGGHSGTVPLRRV